MPKTGKFLALFAASMLALGPVSIIAADFGQDAAYAEAGGKGKSASKKKAAGGAKSSHGAIASELKGLNAAHASAKALANAAEGSQVGRISNYADAYNASLVAAAEAAASAAEVLRLTNLTDAEKYGIVFPDPAIEPLPGEFVDEAAYNAALLAATGDAQTDATDALLAKEATDAALIEAGGADLSPEALAYLNELLGLSS